MNALMPRGKNDPCFAESPTRHSRFGDGAASQGVPCVAASGAEQGKAMTKRCLDAVGDRPDGAHQIASAHHPWGAAGLRSTMLPTSTTSSATAAACPNQPAAPST